MFANIFFLNNALLSNKNIFNSSIPELKLPTIDEDVEHFATKFLVMHLIKSFCQALEDLIFGMSITGLALTGLNLEINISTFLLKYKCGASVFLF